jgi:hypothetical protein
VDYARERELRKLDRLMKTPALGLRKSVTRPEAARACRDDSLREITFPIRTEHNPAVTLLHAQSGPSVEELRKRAYDDSWR